MVLVSLPEVSNLGEKMASFFAPLRSTSPGNRPQSDFWEAESSIRRCKYHIALYVRQSAAAHERSGTNGYCLSHRPMVGSRPRGMESPYHQCKLETAPILQLSSVSLDQSILRTWLTAKPLTAASTGFRKLDIASSKSLSQPIRVLHST
jgi:hypothetical protein